MSPRAESRGLFAKRRLRFLRSTPFRSKWQCIMSPRAESRCLFSKQYLRFLRSTSFRSKWQFYVIPSEAEESLFQTVSEISPLHLAHKCLCARFRSKWQCIMSPRAKPRNLLPNGVWDLSAPLRSGRNDNVLCHLERSRGISCQTASEISPLHFVPVEMTMYYVTSSGVERSLFQTVSEISPLHFVPVEMTVFCHSERSRGISCQTASEISPLHFVPVEMTVLCHSERSRGISFPNSVRDFSTPPST